MSFINWGQESAQQLEARRRAEQEWLMLMEQAINLKRQQSQAGVAGSGGPRSIPVPITLANVGTVMYLDGTWKYFFLDYDNGVIPEPIDTGVPDSHPYFYDFFSGPVQDKGMVFCFSNVPNAPGPVDLYFVYINSRGEIVNTINFASSLGSVISVGGGLMDGIAHLITYTDESTGTGIAYLFDGTVFREYTFAPTPGYFLVILQVGSSNNNTVNGKIPIYSIYVSESLIEADFLVKISLLDIKSGESTLLISDNLLQVGTPQSIMATKDDIFYFGYVDGLGNYLNLKGWSTAGDLIFDVDFTDDSIFFTESSIMDQQNLSYYGTDNLQIIQRYTDGPDAGFMLYNFKGLSKTFSKEVIPLGEYETFITRSSAFNPYTMRGWNSADGILNLFYSGPTVSGLFTTVTKAKAYYHLDGENEYRSYVIKEEADPDRAFLSSGTFVDISGKGLFLGFDLGNESGLSGNLSLVNFGTGVTITNPDITAAWLQGWGAIPIGNNTIYFFLSEVFGEIELRVYSPTGSLIDVFSTTTGVNLGISAETVWLATSTSSYFFNNSNFTEIGAYSTVENSTYGSESMLMDGNLLLTGSEDDSAALIGRIGTRILDGFVEGPVYYLGKSMILADSHETLEPGFKVFDFNGSLLQEYSDLSSTEFDEVYCIGDRGLGIRFTPGSPNTREIVMISKKGIEIKELVGFEENEIVYMLNDIIWYYE